MNTKPRDNLHIAQFSRSFRESVKEHRRYTGTTLHDNRISGLDEPDCFYWANKLHTRLWVRMGHIN